MNKTLLEIAHTAGAEPVVYKYRKQPQRRHKNKKRYVSYGGCKMSGRQHTKQTNQPQREVSCSLTLNKTHNDHDMHIAYRREPIRSET